MVNIGEGQEVDKLVGDAQGREVFGQLDYPLRSTRSFKSWVIQPALQTFLFLFRICKPLEQRSSDFDWNKRGAQDGWGNESYINRV